jgi:hypothetical protein
MTPDPVASRSETNPALSESPFPKGANACTCICTTAGLADRAKSSMAALKSAKVFEDLGDAGRVCAASGPGANNRAMAQKTAVLIMTA